MSERQPPPPPSFETPPPRKGRRLLLVGILVIVVPIFSFLSLAAAVLYAQGWRPYSIPSGSMLPTLLVGDFIWCDSQVYSASAPPQRGDIVVFKYPGDWGRGMHNTDYIMRIIGLPGERIQMTRGRLYIDGKQVERQRVGDYVQNVGHSQYRRGTIYTEVLTEGRRHEIIETTDNGASDNTPEFRVPADSYFMMGDNRDDALDSRTQLQVRDSQGIIRSVDREGWYVSRSGIVCRANYIYWSGTDRLDRIGTAVK